MAKVFVSLAELHRTYTEPVTGQRYVKKKEERAAEEKRMRETVTSGQGKTIRMTLFKALMWYCASSDGQTWCSKTLDQVEICEAWDGHNFYQFATPFEQQHSVLCTDGNRLSNVAIASGEAGHPFMPIVLGTGNFDALVIGHSGVVQGHRLVIPTGVGKKLAATPADALAQGIPFYVIGQETRITEGWAQLSVSDHTYRVMTKPDGQVLQASHLSSRSLVSANWVIDLVVAPATLMLAKSGFRVAMSLWESMPIRNSSKVLAGATREVAEATVAAEVVAARTVTAAKGAYNPVAGITVKHHQAFIEAAKDAEVIIVVRHTNPKSIKLIELGCPGKPKNLEFINTSPETGIVMAVKHEEVLQAQRLGYYVVNAEGKTATRLVKVGNKEVSETMELNHKFWQVEKGQVIHPDLKKPIVGDYDLMGVINPLNPGQNLGLVASNKVVLADVTNPLVQKAAAAVNKRLDMPRVLHGPQDMYKGFRKGASAYHPDGTVMHFESEEAVKAYYKSLGRMPRDGAYPVPPPQVPVVDELAARRAAARR